MNIQLIKKEEQADGNFNNGEILEKKPIQIYFIGRMPGLHIQKVLLVFILIKDLRFVVLY